MVQVNFPSYGTITVSLQTVADLTTFPPRNLVEGLHAIVAGQATVGDGQGGIFTWNGRSAIAADGVSVVAITSLTTGRWIKTVKSIVGPIGDRGPLGPVGPVGPMGPPDNILRNDLATGGAGSSIVGFKLPGTGTVPRTVQQKLSDIIHANDFDIKADGTTDDSANLQLAVNYMSARGGGRLLLPEGKILLNTSVVISGGGVCIEGEGHQATWIVNGTTNKAALAFGNGTNNGNRCALRNVIFGQKAGVTPVDGNSGFSATKQANFIVENVHVFEYPEPLYRGAVFTDCNATHIDNLSSQSCMSDGWLFTRCLDTYASKSRSDTSARGIKFVDCPGVYFNGVACFGNTQFGWDIGSAGVLNDSVYHFYTNCIGDTSGSHNWNITQLSIGSFTGCWGSTQISTSNATAAGFYFSGGNVSDITITASVAISNNGAGINIDLASKVYLTNNIIGSAYKSGAGNGKSGNGSGVLIGPYCNRVRVTGGGCENNSSFGIDIVNGADRVEINGVECRYNNLGAVRNNANGTAHKARIANVGGYNPFGSAVPQPAIAASGTAVRNLSGVDCMVYIEGGTVSSIKVDGYGIFTSTGRSVFVPAGATIAVDYTAPHGWQWYGQ